MSVHVGAGIVRAIAAVLVFLALHAVLGRMMVREIVVSKSQRLLVAYGEDGRVLKRVAVALGRNGSGPKRREGDERTPEGEYYVCFKNTQSRFHLSLGLSYPGPADAAAALAQGVIRSDEFDAIESAHRRREIPPWKTALGGEIFIHGGFEDYGSTAGCVAIRTGDIEEIFPLIELGTRVRIEP